MDNRIFLHIGTHKTGTSAIQNFLTLNKETFSRKGFLYPQKSRRDYYDSIDGQTIVVPRKYKNYAKLVKLCRSRSKHVILSSETFSLIHDVSPIRTALGDASVTVICYLRRQDSFVQSQYNQSVKSGKNYKDINEWSPETSLDYYELLNRWAAVFGRKNIVVRPYERQQFKNGDLINDFLSILGIDSTDGFRKIEKNSNPRLPVEAVEYTRLLNSLLRDKKESKYIRRKIVEYFVEKDRENAATLFFDHLLLHPDQSDALLARYAASNQKVAQKYMGREDGRLFLESPPRSAPALSREPLSDECIDQITRSLCRDRKIKKMLTRAHKRDYSQSDAFTHYAHATISDILKRL